MDISGYIELGILIVLLFFSAFFSSTETALSSISRAKIRTFEEENRRHWKTLSKVMDDYDRMLTTVLVGNNIVNISASALATTLTIRLWGNVYVSVATGILTFLVLIFGEIVPKTWARRNCERISLTFSPIIRVIMVILFPAVILVGSVARFILFISGQSKSDENLITESELRSYVDVSKEDGAIESDEHKIINNVFDFSDSVAKDIMIPRIDMTVVSDEAGYREVMKVFRETMYTRIPVYHDKTVNIIGFINIKDLIRLKDVSAFSVSKFLREGHYTYEYKKTNDLLLEMRNISMNLAFVRNEFNETVGMITLEDLLEELVGQIRDEFDQDESDEIKEEDGGYLIEAKVKLEDVNDFLSTDFKSEDYDTIGGLVLDQIDRIPEDNEAVTLEDGTVLQVRGISMNRISKVFVKLPDKNEDSEAEDK